MCTEQLDKKGNCILCVTVHNIGLTKEIYLASRYDANKEAGEFAKYHGTKLKSVNILYGLGLGYHIVHLLPFLDADKKLYVFENRADVAAFASEKGLYHELKISQQVEFFIDDDEMRLLKKMRGYLQEDAYFFMHPSSVYAIHEAYSPSLKYILESMKFNRLPDREKRLSELTDNEHKNILFGDEEAMPAFAGKFSGKPAILVSAGPSLKETLPYLAGLRQTHLIFTVGRALRVLMNQGIEPDFIGLIDGSELTYEQIRGYEYLSVPLIYLSTASYRAVSAYQGPRYIFYNEREKVRDSQWLVPTGGSVATAVFSLLIRFGCNPIVFVGQDLGYVQNQNYHEDAYYTESDKNKLFRSQRRVKNVRGEYMDTTLEYLKFKRWFEQQIEKYPDILFYNASLGAHIEGTIPIDFSKYAEKFSGGGKDVGY